MPTQVQLTEIENFLKDDSLADARTAIGLGASDVATLSGVNFIASGTTGSFDFVRPGDAGPLLSLSQFGASESARRVEVRGEGLVARTDAGLDKVNVSQYGLRLTSGVPLTWSSSATSPSAIDLQLSRLSADTLKQSRSTNAQTYKLYADDSGANYSRLSIAAATSAITFAAEVGGTHASDNVDLKFVPKGTGTHNFYASNGTTLGALHAESVRSLGSLRTLGAGTLVAYESDGTTPASFVAGQGTFSGRTISGSASTATMAIATTWNTTGTPTALKVDVTDTASNAASLLMDLRVGGSSKVSVTKAGTLNLSSTAGMYGGTQIMYFQSASNTKWIMATNGGEIFSMGSGGALAWSSGTNAAQLASCDAMLYRDSAGRIAQRNGAVAQAFRVYGTYTDASNYVRAALNCDSSGLALTGESDGSGSANLNIVMNPKGTGLFVVTARALFAASTTSRASLNVPSGTAPTTPVNGDIWSTATQHYTRLGGTTYRLLRSAAASTYTPSNDSTLRAFDANSTNVDELADVVATLIKDLGLDA